MANRTPVRIGVIGLGGFGRLHAETLRQIAEGQVVALVDSCQEAIAAAQRDFPDVPCWQHLDEALVHADAEAWIVASSTVSHVPLAKRLLEHGHRVLVEKPLAASLSAAHELKPLIAADSNNLMLGHIVLFNSEFRQLCDEVSRRGLLNYIECTRHRPSTTLQAYPGESPLHLTMVHDMYCVQVLMKAAEPSKFQVTTHCNPAGDCDLVSVRLQWPCGTIAALTASFLTPPGMPCDGFDRLEIFGDGWAARMQPNPRPLELWDDRARWPLSLEILASNNSASGMLAEELRAFCRVVRNEQAVPFGARYADAIQLQQWLDRCEFALQERRTACNLQ